MIMNEPTVKGHPVDEHLLNRSAGYGALGRVIALAATLFMVAHAKGGEPPPRIERSWLGTGPGDRQFGYSVALSGPWAAVATDRSDESLLDRGSVRLYRIDAESDEEAAILRAPDRRWPDRFGAAMDFVGGELLIGAPMDAESGWDGGAAWHFTEEHGEWSAARRLLPARHAAGRRFGSSVSLDGEYAAVGAPRDDERGLDCGAVHLFRRKGSEWLEIQVVHAPDAGVADFFGSSVALHGDWLAVGAWGDDDVDEKCGAVWIFHRERGRWRPHQKLVPDRARGRDLFGWAIAFAGEDLIISACGADDNRGRVLVYRRTGRRWGMVERLQPETAQPEERFGFALDACGELLVIGSPLASGATTWSGRTSIYRRADVGWQELGSVDAGVEGWTQPTQFGWAVATDGRSCMVGRIDDADGIPEPGRAWLVSVPIPRGRIVDAPTRSRVREW